MNGSPGANPKDIDLYYENLLKESEASGYHLNPDINFVKALIAGLLTNRERYGYLLCPCRLASGRKEDDLDIICPCDYRDADLGEYGSCFCALYVTEAVLQGNARLASIPERRSAEGSRTRSEAHVREMARPSLPVWRCRVCGYLCAREEPPGTCPICKAAKECFERFL
jgi:ferredoxin-thioredoxin reductase catalytic subunit